MCVCVCDCVCDCVCVSVTVCVTVCVCVCYSWFVVVSETTPAIFASKSNDRRNWCVYEELMCVPSLALVISQPCLQTSSHWFRLLPYSAQQQLAKVSC